MERAEDGSSQSNQCKDAANELHAATEKRSFASENGASADSASIQTESVDGLGRKGGQGEEENDSVFSKNIKNIFDENWGYVEEEKVPPEEEGPFKSAPCTENVRTPAPPSSAPPHKGP